MALSIANKLYQGFDLPVTPQEFAEVEVTYHKLKIKKSPFELYFNGDVHVSSPEFIKDFWEYSIDRIKKRRNCAFIHMGDGHENNNKTSPGYSQFSQKETNEEASDYIKYKHKPIRKKNWVWHEGNHGGERSRDKIGTSVDREIAQFLDVPYSRISCYHIIDWNDYRLIIYTNHGKKRTTPTWRGTKTKIRKESLIYKDADIIALGHIHRLKYEDIELDENITENIIIDYNNMRMEQQEAQFNKLLITGHFLTYLGGYGQKDGYPPNPAGYPILKLYPNGTYDVEKVWEREWRNNLKRS